MTDSQSDRASEAVRSTQVLDADGRDRRHDMHVIRDPASTVSRVGPGVSVQVRPVPTLDGIVGDELNGRMDDLIGTPGSATALFATLSVPPVLTPYGFQWADLRAYVVLDVGLVDAMGQRTLSVPLPSIYPIGEALVFQSIVLDQGQKTIRLTQGAESGIRAGANCKQCSFTG